MLLTPLANCVAIPPAACEAVAPIVRAGLAQARRDGFTVPAELLALADELEMAAATSRARRDVVAGVVVTTGETLSSGILHPVAPSEIEQDASVTVAARHLRCSRQAVLARISRGTLPARRDTRGHWRIATENLDPIEGTLNA